MVYKWEITIPQLSGDEPRRVYVHLPHAYDRNPTRRYPVLYMFDGHNIFFDSDATYGKSWGMNAYMNRTRKPLIIIAVECNHTGNGRMEEYSPFSFEDPSLGKINGKGKAYMDWLVNELKPYVDQNLRTKPGRRNTFLAGSSMGGLMSLYGVIAYNHVFQRAACLSPSLWTEPKKLLNLVRRTDIRQDTVIYLDFGSKEIQNHAATPEAMVSISQALLERHANLTFRIVPDGNHSEASWEKQIPIFLACLGL